jgi:hypothetical protein
MLPAIVASVAAPVVEIHARTSDARSDVVRRLINLQM